MIQTTVKNLIEKLSQYPEDAEVRGNLQINSHPSIEEGWEPTMDDIGECDVMGIY